MQSKLVLASGAIAALLWIGPALALSPETRCENTELHAVGQYERCLAQVASEANAVGSNFDAAAIKPCNDRFDWAFDRVQATDVCRTAGGPVTLRGPVLAQFEDTLAAVENGLDCPSPTKSLADGYYCTLTTGSTVDLAAIVNQINTHLGGKYVNDNSVVWIEAWGGDGGAGNTDNGGPGGTGGYAQMATTVNQQRAFYGTSEIYYYLGKAGGGPKPGAGGDGGTGTIVSVDDLTSEEPSYGTTLLVAGGAGGGGAGRGTNACLSKHVYGAAGGYGGQAISTLGTAAFGAGAKGGARRNKNFSGSGGGGTIDGSGGAINGAGNPSVGDDGLAMLGGPGGGSHDPIIGFTNQSGVQITLSGGHGGEPGYDAGGGGGGGGYGGGGGGAQGLGSTDCVAGGGGGGGSMARAATVSCHRNRPIKPKPVESYRSGIVQIIFKKAQEPCN